MVSFDEACYDASHFLQLLANWQFRFLVAGAFLYVAWPVLEMYLRTI